MMPSREPTERGAGDVESSEAKIVGHSGSSYYIKQVLQEKGDPPHRFCLAYAGNQKFILKDVPAPQFEYIQGIYRELGNNQYLRVSNDTIPERSMFVFDYFADHLLSFAQKELPILLTKRILKGTLRGLAAMHDHNIVHTDVKANNILVDWENEHLRIVINQVNLADIEDAVYVGPTSDIVGIQFGNLMWRSPEAHCQASVNKPSDIFSFGIVCLYAVTKKAIFAVDQEELGEGEVPLAVILERQISYFADEQGLNGFLKHLGDSPWRQVLEVLRDGFKGTNTRKPISLWQGIDDDFRDLVTGLTKFDPAQRFTANEALEHKWFREVE